jgi:hypothetical protein
VSDRAEQEVWLSDQYQTFCVSDVGDGTWGRGFASVDDALQESRRRYRHMWKDVIVDQDEDECRAEERDQRKNAPRTIFAVLRDRKRKYGKGKDAFYEPFATIQSESRCSHCHAPIVEHKLPSVNGGRS